MTLFELTDPVAIQGNVEIKIFDGSGNEKESLFYRDQSTFIPRYEGCDELEDCEVLYIYPMKSYDGTPWLVIEITKDYDD